MVFTLLLEPLLTGRFEIANKGLITIDKVQYPSEMFSWSASERTHHLVSACCLFYTLIRCLKTFCKKPVSELPLENMTT